MPDFPPFNPFAAPIFAQESPQADTRITPDFDYAFNALADMHKRIMPSLQSSRMSEPSQPGSTSSGAVMPTMAEMEAVNSIINGWRNNTIGMANGLLLKK